MKHLRSLFGMLSEQSRGLRMQLSWATRNKCLLLIFFGRGAADDSDEADLESILDQALGSGIKHHRLTGHYRSRHESLIAFSNSHYYENSLVTFPSAETKESAVSFHKVNGVYSKGKGRKQSH